MSASRTFKSARLVRLGDILHDEHKHLVLLCRNCHKCFRDSNAFYSHLKRCAGLDHIVTPIDELNYNEDKRQVCISGKQELLIYDIDAVCSANDINKREIDLQAELNDPKWYLDEKQTATSEAVVSSPILNAPPPSIRTTNAKENVKSLASSKVQELSPLRTEQSPTVKILTQRHKRSILINQPQRKSQVGRPSNNNKSINQIIKVPEVLKSLAQLEADEIKPRVTIRTTKPVVAATIAASPTKTVPKSDKTSKATPVVSTPTTVSPKTNSADPSKDTQKLLNKLKACGVQVKRRQNSDSTSDSDAPNQKKIALEIMRKLQSKGIKCTKINAN